jgi:hypothetical protein
MNLFMEGVGLPPFRGWYQDPIAPSLSHKPLSWFAPYVQGKGVIYRSALQGYRSIAPRLATYLVGVLCAQEERDAAAARLDSAADGLQKLLERSSPPERKRRHA